jgi:endonuclease YncB( thermonuclease family)
MAVRALAARRGAPHIEVARSCRGIVIRLASLAALVVLLAAPSSASAQRHCSKGKPCGNTCIARDKVCRIESPGAVDRASRADRAAARRASARRPGRVASRLPAATTPCTIARVVDGDTVECAGGTRVRLLLIDAPERGQRPYGAMATRALRTLVPVATRAALELDVQQRDRYGRLLAYLYAPDGRMANEEMVRGGYALLYTYPPNVRHVDRIRAAQDEAKTARRGLWSTSAFECTPAAHRRRAC